METPLLQPTQRRYITHISRDTWPGPPGLRALTLMPDTITVTHYDSTMLR